MRKLSLTRVASLAAVPVVALALAACGGDDSNSSSTAAPPATSVAAPPATSAGSSTGASGSATVDVGSTDLGSILVDAQGRTLYLFQADSGTTSSCTGSCAVAWPPLLANGQPTVANGVDQSLLGTTQRTDGSSQVTYNGHPLYTFVQDTATGQTNGEGKNAFGGLWYALSPAGAQVTGAAGAAAPASPATTAASSGGY